MERDMYYLAAACGTNSSALSSDSFTVMRFMEKASIPFLVIAGCICIPVSYIFLPVWLTSLEKGIFFLWKD